MGPIFLLLVFGEKRQDAVQGKHLRQGLEPEDLGPGLIDLQRLEVAMDQDALKRALDQVAMTFPALFERVFRGPSLGYVGVNCDQAAARHRVAPDFDDPSAVQSALGHRWFPEAWVRHHLGDDFLRIAGTVDAALGVVALGVGDRGAGSAEP